MDYLKCITGISTVPADSDMGETPMLLIYTRKQMIQHPINYNPCH